MKKKILIAGAGIGGLTAALACLRQGFDVEVYEQAKALKVCNCLPMAIGRFMS
jgi:salicylate hydroxylase